jgi:hypothetical protein
MPVAALAAAHAAVGKVLIEVRKILILALVLGGGGGGGGAARHPFPFGSVAQAIRHPKGRTRVA